MEFKRYSKVLVFIVSILLTFFDCDLAKAGWRIETVDSGVTIPFYISIAIDGNDNPRISYDDTLNDLKYAYYDGSWHTEVVDSDGLVGTYNSLAIAAFGVPRISYFDNTNDDLKFAFWFSKDSCCNSGSDSSNSGCFINTVAFGLRMQNK